MADMLLFCSEFANGQPIPARFTCSGEDVSPPLSWSNLPSGTLSLALIVDDPDAPAGVWVHWVFYNIPSNLSGLAEAMPKNEVIEGCGTQGRNDFGQLGYNGPCPPPGRAHRYYFTLYAVSRDLRLMPGLNKKNLLISIEGHILARAQWMGTYQRQ
jgi:Raf kinase inhibitor-like YbhB/YbcL family protein